MTTAAAVIHVFFASALLAWNMATQRASAARMNAVRGLHAEMKAPASPASRTKTRIRSIRRSTRSASEHSVFRPSERREAAVSVAGDGATAPSPVLNLKRRQDVRFPGRLGLVFLAALAALAAFHNVISLPSLRYINPMQVAETVLSSSACSET